MKRLSVLPFAAPPFSIVIIPNTAYTADASIFKWEVIENARYDENDILH